MAASDDVLAELRKEGDGTLVAMRREMSRTRTGRASTALLEGITVEYYGSPTPLNQVAAVSAPEPSLLTVQPWDPSVIKAIEKAIQTSDLNLNPSNDGKIVRIPIPPLNDERRKELSRHVHKLAEEGRNHVRTVRRDANDKLKKMLKDHAISEDDEKRALADVQKATDEHVKAIDDLQQKKDAELLGK